MKVYDPEELSDGTKKVLHTFMRIGHDIEYMKVKRANFLISFLLRSGILANDKYAEEREMNQKAFLNLMKNAFE